VSTPDIFEATIPVGFVALGAGIGFLGWKRLKEGSIRFRYSEQGIFKKTDPRMFAICISFYFIAAFCVALLGVLMLL
jgi:hypothetical protein